LRLVGSVTQSDEIVIDGCLAKGESEERVTLKVDTGFTGYDVAVPSNIAQKLGLNPSSGYVEFSTPSGEIPLATGDDAILCLGDRKYRVSYVVHYGAYPLLSSSFLRRISEIMIIDFVNDSAIIVLK
jgi:predicted aspartyl protease